jgi:predicted aldo/keto reductase-like oxidoreductase
MARRGSLHHKAKLDDDKVRAIREEYAQGGTSYFKLAMKYDIESTDTIGKIIRRKAWTHVC